MAGLKPTAQKQLCSFNPAPFSQYRAECSGRLTLERTALISKVPRNWQENKPSNSTQWISVHLVPFSVAPEMIWACPASRMFFWPELKSSAGKPVAQDEFYECLIVRNSLQNQSLNQLPQGSLPLLYVSSAAEWNSNKFPSVSLCSVEILMLIASPCLGWGLLWGLDFCLESHTSL